MQPARAIRSTGYIVRLKRDNQRAPAPDVATAAFSIASKHRIAAPHTLLDETIRGFAVGHLPGHVLHGLRLDDRVESVEPDIEVRACAQTVPWSIARIGAAVDANGGGGAPAAAVDAHIFVLDTGVQSRHPDLNVVESVSFVRTERSTDDLNGHGTMVAGCAAARNNSSHVVGVAPGAKIHSYKVLDRSGGGSLSVVIAAIDRVIRFKQGSPASRVVINLSLGGYAGTTAYTALDAAVRTAVRDHGIPVVVAAGNESMNAALCTPAHTAEALTVGAYDSANAFARFSNFGSVVDVLAPGQNVLTTAVGSTTATASGTSFSCPYAAGAAALYLAAHPLAAPDQVAAALVALAAAAGPDANPPIAGVPADTTPYGLFVRDLWTPASA